MVFSSMAFLFRFLPIFLIAYFVTPARYRNITLLLGSLFFYAYGEPLYIFLMLLSIFINHLMAQKMFDFQILSRKRGRNTDNHQRQWLALALCYDFGMLILFKYLDFFTGNLNALLGHDLFPALGLTLPLGISFYTFQIASYMIDVYRGKYVRRQNLINFATYVCMFPQLIAGPIVNYDEVMDDLKSRKVDYAQIEYGIITFILGLSYKVLLANKIASLWNEVQTSGPRGINMPIAWLGAWGFSMQIFFDFFGYSLMAIGLGYILGFEFPTNFDNPYGAKSATEFWRRWHITLGRWFRDYVYIPLGGNRKGPVRLVINTAIVWGLTGLWHGADWNFIIWGLMFFVLLTAEKFFYLDKLEAHPIAGHVYMLILIPLSWVVFNISDLNLLGEYLCKMFFIPVAGTVAADMGAKFMTLLGKYGGLLVICAACCTPVPVRLIRYFKQSWSIRVVAFILFWLCVIQIAKGGNNPFLYFRF